MIGGKVVKVCGMRDGDNIREVESLGVDLMGFILYPKSPRFVDELPSYMPNETGRVGVFVNETIEVVEEAILRLGLDVVQLHGGEPVAMCRALRERGVEVFKAISVASVADLSLAEAYEGACDMIVFDTKCDGHGGSGEQFDWSILECYKGMTPFLLSGGVSLESVESIKRFRHPRLAGYDINSRFECSPAVKNIRLIEQFLKELNEDK